MIEVERGNGRLPEWPFPKERAGSAVFMATFPFPLSRRRTWILGSLVAVILLIITLSYLISSEFMRRYMEQQMNRKIGSFKAGIGMRSERLSHKQI
jgi:hypothetical protein